MRSRVRQDLELAVCRPTFALLVLAGFGCSGSTPSESADVKAKRAGIKVAIDAIRGAPNTEKGAKCERQGLTFARNEPVVDGNAEIIHVDRDRDYEIEDAVDIGPLGYLAYLGDSADASARKPHLVRAGATQTVVLIKEYEVSHMAEVYLAELPSGAIACKTMIEPSGDAKPPLYDPSTGDRPTSAGAAATDHQRERFEALLEQELAARFGVPRSQAAAPSPAATAAAQRFKKMKDALTAAPPACTDPDPPGTVRTTVLRLGVYAGAPLLAETDLNYLVELEEWISPEFRDLVDASKRSERDAIHAKLAKAPATSVLDVPRGTLGSFAIEDGGLRSETFHPGAITARTVRFGPDGAPVCQTEVELKNPSQLTITYNGMDYTKALAVTEASADDFKNQLRSAFMK